MTQQQIVAKLTFECIPCEEGQFPPLNKKVNYNPQIDIILSYLSGTSIKISTS